MPRVSVIIPTYNHAHFLPDAVQSVFDQTFQDFEIIVVDDGSTDNTCNVIQAYIDNRFKYIHQENQGLAASRNTGLRAAQGEFVVFLDADDILLPCKLEVQVAWMQAHEDYGLVASGWNIIDNQGMFLKAELPWLYVPQIEVRDWLFNCPALPHSVLVRKKWVDYVGGFDKVFRYGVEDWDLWLRLAYVGCKMAWVKEIVCGYRLSPGQLTRDAATMKSFSIYALDKFFNQVGVPSHLLSLKTEAYTNQYLACAGREYGAGQCNDGKESVAQAIKHTPDLLETRQSELIIQLLSWTDNPFVGDPVDYTKRVFDNLPDEAAKFRSKKHWALGEIGLRILYESYQAHDWPQVRKAGTIVAANAPHRMLNRGVLSILWQSLKN